jgi:hypothetical protein
MSSSIDTKSNFKAVLEQIPIVLKVTGITGSICGFIYLFSYAQSVGIPFPLELNVLPTMLFLVGITSVTATIFLVVGVLIPALMAEEPISVTMSYFLVSNNLGTHRHVRLTKFFRYIAISWVPMATALVALMFQVGVWECDWKKWAAWSLLCLSVAWIFATPFVVKELHEKRWQYIPSAFLQTLMSVWAYCLAIVLFLGVYSKANSWPAAPSFVGALIVFSALHMFITLPHRRGAVVLPPYYETRVTPATGLIFIIAACFVFLSLTLQPLSAMVGKAALRIFGIGGGIQMKVCLKNKPPAEVAKVISFGLDNCSEISSALFDAGDKLYLTKLIPEIDSKPEDAKTRLEFIQIRQDEILEKIYPSPPPKKKEDATSKE